MWHPTNEVWLPVQKYPEYEVSNLGRIRKKNKHYYPQWPSQPTPEYRYYKCSYRGGYKRLSIYRNKRPIVIAHAVLEAFVGPRPVGMQCDHINRIKDDDRMVNLRWVTCSVNQRNRFYSPEEMAKRSQRLSKLMKERNQTRDPQTGQFISKLQYGSHSLRIGD